MLLGMLSSASALSMRRRSHGDARESERFSRHFHRRSSKRAAPGSDEGQQVLQKKKPRVAKAAEDEFPFLEPLDTSIDAIDDASDYKWPLVTVQNGAEDHSFLENWIRETGVNNIVLEFLQFCMEGCGDSTIDDQHLHPQIFLQMTLRTSDYELSRKLPPAPRFEAAELSSALLSGALEEGDSFYNEWFRTTDLEEGFVPGISLESSGNGLAATLRDSLRNESAMRANQVISGLRALPPMLLYANTYRSYLETRSEYLDRFAMNYTIHTALAFELFLSRVKVSSTTKCIGSSSTAFYGDVPLCSLLDHLSVQLSHAMHDLYMEIILSHPRWLKGGDNGCKTETSNSLVHESN